MCADTHHTLRSTGAVRAVDFTDWLKTVAICLVVVDHIGYFFIEAYDWWSVVGRWAAPPFFFLLGFAHTRTIPLTWVWLGGILTVLDSWNNGWTWVAPNILLSFALIRLARPRVRALVQRHGWTAFTALVCALLLALPFAAHLVDYGSAGWLWALFGLCQRVHIDGRRDVDPARATGEPASPAHALTGYAGPMRSLACLVAAAVYLWREQVEFSFPAVQFGVFAMGICVLSVALMCFRRGPSRIQPPAPVAGMFRFLGRRTLEIYAIQLAGSELAIILWSVLAA